MKNNNNIDHISRKYERLLYAIVAMLVFEGIARKVVPSSIGLLIFFLKDLLCLLSLYYINNAKLSITTVWLKTIWAIVAVAFIPLLIYTAFLDLPLSVFAVKQYLLYVVTGLLVPLAFPSDQIEKFKRFSLYFSSLLLPTTFVAILQNSLPSTHWLNLTIGGTSMEEFSAAGFLRVSSTFSFTGQYSWFLNAVCSFIVVVFFSPINERKNLVLYKTFIPVALSILLTIGVFITGGRTAVLGNAGCIVIGFLLSVWKFPSLSARKGILISMFIIPTFWLIHYLKPEFFAAYDARSTGTEEMSNEAEIQSRILGTFLDWTDWYGEQDFSVMIIGNGLGIMSNGSDRVSSYAQDIRSTGFWTEGDIPTTIWEGGIYLLIIWYGFRLIVIGFCFRLWLSIKEYKLSSISAFLLANVVINGIIGTIGMQPPIAIWWWISVGSILAIHSFDKKSSENKFVKVDKCIYTNRHSIGNSQINKNHEKSDFR